MAQKKLAISVDTAFGLDFFIEKAPDQKSGFKPADSDFGGKLFCDLRTEGFAALLRVGFAKKLVLTGTDEVRPELEGVNRGWATKEMLVRDLDADPGRISVIKSAWATYGNAEAITDLILLAAQPEEFAAVTSHYHIARSSIIFKWIGLIIPCYPAEAFLLVENINRKQEIVRRLGGSPLAERIGEELQGIAHIIRGTYNSRK